MVRSVRVFAGLSSLLLASAALAAVPLPTISTADLAAKVKSAPPEQWGFTVVDARSGVEYGEAHIPGAINVPALETKSKLPKLVKDKNRPLFFYCNGPRCTKSRKGAHAAIALGYRHVTEYNEGLPGWGKSGNPIASNPLPSFVSPSMSPAALHALIGKKGAPTLIDVRDRDEFAEWHIAGSKNIPLDELAKALPSLQGKSLCLVDHSGFQEAMAGRLLHSLKRANFTHLDGGLLAWQSQGLPVEQKKP
jgi:rhodanese-related sulfurtransferase